MQRPAARPYAPTGLAREASSPSASSYRTDVRTKPLFWCLLREHKSSAWRLRQMQFKTEQLNATTLWRSRRTSEYRYHFTVWHIQRLRLTIRVFYSVPRVAMGVAHDPWDDVPRLSIVQINTNEVRSVAPHSVNLAHLAFLVCVVRTSSQTGQGRGSGNYPPFYGRLCCLTTAVPPRQRWDDLQGMGRPRHYRGHLPSLCTLERRPRNYSIASFAAHRPIPYVRVRYPCDWTSTPCTTRPGSRSALFCGLLATW